MSLRCEVHANCREPVVAKVGLPTSHAMWVCEEGFNEFRGEPLCEATVGMGGLRCKLRAGHAGNWHESGSTRWNTP